MKRTGISPNEPIVNAPQLLPCGAFVSQRIKTARCQECYGRRRCRCAQDTRLPCVAGTHYALNPKRATGTGRLNRGFVDINANRRGMGRAG